jgi:hypothetical protein
MPSIEELLNEAESHMAAQPVNDVLEINPETREISIPDSEIILGVETDQKAERKYFHCPKIVGNNIDLSALELYVVFQNASNKEEGKDRYHVTDVKTTSDGYITFSWELSAKVTAYKGDVQFVVCAIKTDSSGVKQNVWNTTIAIGKCLIGLSSDMSASEEQSASDLYTQLISELNSTASAKLAEVTTQIQTVGNNQVSNVNNAGTTQVSNVQNKGTEVLASIPDTYTELDASVKQLNEQIEGKAPVITESTTIQSGSPTTVTDSAEMQLQGLRLYGKSEQKTTTGKNLLPITDKDVTQVNGVTFTKNGDGTCTVNGTASSVAWYRLGSDFTVPAGTYTISDGTVSNNQSHFSDDNLTAGYNYSEKRTVTYDSEHIFKPYIRINVGSVLNNVTFKPMLNIGSEALPFEPYTGGKPSPSPEYPQEIVSVGGSGSIGVEITGKNLFGGKAFADKIVELGGMLVGDNVKIDASKIGNNLIYKFADSSKRYTIIVEGVNSSKIQAVNLSVHYSDGTTGGFGEFNNGKRIVVTTKDAIGVYGSWYTGEATYTKFGIFEGQVKESDYEPYKESKAIIQIQGGLLGIPVNTGGNYTDENGQQYICDEIDFSRGKYVQRVWQTEFDGSEDEKWEICSSYEYFYCLKLPSDMSSRKGFSNQYADDKFRIGNGNNAIIIFDANYFENNLSNWEAHLAQHPLVVMTYLDAPIETDLTEAQIQAYKSLTTFKPTSIISNDANAQMNVEYACDTKTWVTNKINTLIKEATTS